MPGKFFFLVGLPVFLVSLLVLASHITGQNLRSDIIAFGEPKVRINNVKLDRVSINLNVTLRNESSVQARIAKVEIWSGKSKDEINLGVFPRRLRPGEKSEISGLLWRGLERGIGSLQVQGTMAVIDQNGKVVGRRGIVVRVPMKGIGDLQGMEGTHQFVATPTSWLESYLAVLGPYGSDGKGYYTYAASSGRKFTILFFKTQNNWVRPQRESLHGTAEIGTDRGHIYPAYYGRGKRRMSTPDEIKNLSCPNGELLPGESTRDCLVFEIPEDEKPIEVGHSKLTHVIQLDKPAAKNIVQDQRFSSGGRKDGEKKEAAALEGIYEVLYDTVVYSAAREDSRKVAEVKSGTKIRVIAGHGDWLEIRSRHGRPPGFVRKDALSKLD